MLICITEKALGYSFCKHLPSKFNILGNIAIIRDTELDGAYKYLPSGDLHS